MRFSLKSLILVSLPLVSALTEREVEAAYQAQARVVSLLKGRQVTTVPCAKIQAPATCASSCGPGWTTCPGGSAKDCYNPATEVCCGDGTTCPAGTTCNISSLSCDGSGTFVAPTYTPTTSTNKPTTTSTTKPTTSKTATTPYYTPATFTNASSVFDVTSSDGLFASPASAAATSATSHTSASGNISTNTSPTTSRGATTSSSGVGIVQSNDAGMVEPRVFGAVVVTMAGYLLLCMSFLK